MSSAAQRVWIVTGANQGIGYHIVEQLYQQLDASAVIVLCSRNGERGQAAQAAIESQHGGQAARIEGAVLDIDSQESIAAFAEDMTRRFPHGVHCLVNNAGMAFKGDAFDEHVARTTFQTNYHGTIRATRALLPLLQKDSSPRVVVVGSRAGSISRVPSADLQEKYRAAPERMSLQDVDAEVEQFTAAVADGSYASKGWPRSAYGMSKLLLQAYLRVWAAQCPDVLFLSCCPGWCRTSMAGDKAPLSADQGARCPVWLATESADKLVSGRFYAGDFQQPSVSFNEISY